MKKSVLSVCCLALAAASASAGEFKPAREKGVPGEYIVVLEDGVARRGRPAGAPDLPDQAAPRAAEVVAELTSLYGGEVVDVWEHALQGYLVRMPEQAARALARDPKVKAVEQNGTVLSVPIPDCYALNTTDPAAWRPFPTSPQTITCPTPDPQDPTGVCTDNWGIDRIDQASSSRDARYYFEGTGAGVHVYLLDTGIRASHTEFQNASGQSRIGPGFNALAAPGTPAQHDVTDNQGHGTHVAGIVGGKTYGVAKGVTIHAVKVTDTGGIDLADLIEGLNWIAHNSQGPAVASLSANGTAMASSTALHTAVRGVFGYGVQFVQSAGNQQADACSYSVGSAGAVPETLVVGGSDEVDARWTRRPGDPRYSDYCGTDCGSNTGSCIDLWAPAAHIVSASREGDGSYCRLSGTSMAAPHAAGVAALYLERNQGANTLHVRNRLVNHSLTGVLNGTSIGAGSPNRLLSTNAATSWVDATACFTGSCNWSTRTCTFSATCSSFDPDTFIYKYSWDFGDGTGYYGGSSSVTHTFPANDAYSVKLRLIMWSGEAPEKTKCANVSGVGVYGCIQ